MIMVIFGAGASHDSVPSLYRPSHFPRDLRDGRPPLAADLFSEVYGESISQFPRSHPIVPYLRAIPTDSSVEHVLETLQAEGDLDPERKCQLAAVRCYLQFLISECERHWPPAAHRITNYVTLFDQLRRTGDQILIVTFNYDRLIERALESLGVFMTEINGYISNSKIKLIKLHGSVNWAREVETEIANVGGRTVWDVMNELIGKGGDLRLTDRFRIVDGHPIGSIERTPLIPAIAIPVETKTDFECPSGHLDCLRQMVSSVTKVLIVGWRGAEGHFLKLVQEHGLRNIPAQIVADKKASAEEILQRITATGLTIKGDPCDEQGFTPYVASRRAENFFAS